MIKKYYKIELKNKTSLTIGCGKNEETDSDIIRDSYGKPVLPASSIAGVCREYFLIKSNGEIQFKKEEFKEIFGFIDGDKQKESELIFYDGKIVETKKTSIRDSVALNEEKVSIEGAKFDFEVLEPGAKFITYLEANYESEEESIYLDEVIEKICLFMKSGDMRLGAKTTRGYGVIKAEKIQKIQFDLTNKEELKNWLNFDLMKDSKKWSNYNMKSNNYESKYETLKIKIHQNSPLAIRKYTTEVAISDEISIPDMEQLTITNKNNEELPIIPGTSWAGVFRHHLEKINNFMDDENKVDVNLAFGQVSKTEATRSKIIFGETILKNAMPKIRTRNAIDRFTGGAVDTSLFTEKIYYGGSGDLEIKIDKQLENKQQIIKFLEYALLDLHNGFVSVGGNTSIGYGLFGVDILEINGKKESIEQLNIKLQGVEN